MCIALLAGAVNWVALLCDACVSKLHKKIEMYAAHLQGGCWTAVRTLSCMPAAATQGLQARAGLHLQLSVSRLGLLLWPP